jgi:hypothetical protein
MLPANLIELRVTGAVDALRRTLAERLQRQDYSQDPGRIRLALNPTETAGQILHDVLSLAREVGATIEGINSTGRQLEDAYLKLITDDEFRGFLRVSEKR